MESGLVDAIRPHPNPLPQGEGGTIGAGLKHGLASRFARPSEARSNFTGHAACVRPLDSPRGH